MPIELAQTALMQFLRQKNAKYFGKVAEVRDEVKGWLAYIPQTFPHYTRHTIEHSEEIVSQISQLLFRDGDVDAPVLPKLSAAEAYVLVISAFLHDSGMVASDQEKARILAASEWKDWITSGGGATRWKEIEQLRNGGQPADPALRDFLADVQVRYLIAEFIRRRHHLRAGEVVREHQEKLGRFAFNDPSLTKTIADICVAHGLRTHELFDTGRFPQRRDVGGEKVNVRLMAILLRLGDLLDMKYDRACPLLLNAASPLPAESLAHWSQYQRIEHVMVSPDRVEIHARCETQDEHRYLFDWCQWLVQEVHEAAFSTMRAERHSEWNPPTATLDGPGATISIEPAPSATYFPSKWTFQLDSDAVLKRLIYDAYDTKHVFIRELIQNAADANRCQMYDDLRRDGIDPPDSPTKVDPSIRERYPIRISSRTIEERNELSGEIERKQVLTVDDSGIGMDRHVIENYFLQVGRSFYISDEFRRRYEFTPTSRFGVGFLSSFAESDHIEVETYKPASSDGPIRLTLKGPRSYLLTEKSARGRSGTSIALKLNDAIGDADLEKMIRHWCKRLEYPVEFHATDGRREVIGAETTEQFVQSVPDLERPGGSISLVALPIDQDGIEGELYVLARIAPDGTQDWGFGDAAFRYRQRHPRQPIPDAPPVLVCMYGINVSSNWQSIQDLRSLASHRLDWRRHSEALSLSRSRISGNEVDVAIRNLWQTVLLRHFEESPLAAGDDGWLYRNRVLASVSPTAASGLETFDLIPAVTRIYRDRQLQTLSVGETLTVGRFAMFATSHGEYESDAASAFAMDHSTEVPVIPPSDFTAWHFNLQWRFFDTVVVTHAERVPGGDLWLIHGTRLHDPHPESMVKAILPDDVFALRVRRFGRNITVFNQSHPAAVWLAQVATMCEQGDHGLRPKDCRWLEEKILESGAANALVDGARALEIPNAEDAPPIGTIVELQPF